MYLNLNDKNEMKILNSNGVSNYNIIFLLSIVFSLIGIFLLLLYYSFSASLKSKYLDVKNKFSNSNEYLAVVKDDGLWIKEAIDDNVYFIHAENLTKLSLNQYYNRDR